MQPPAEQEAATEPSALELALAKLESSGLTAEDMTALRMVALSPDETRARHKAFAPLPSLLIPYFDPREPTKPLTPRPSWPPFYRIRYLGAKTKTDDSGKTIRYMNEPNAGVAAYFPPTINWPSVLADTDATILITEGELKAAAAAKYGYPCIGLGGVWNFRTTQLGETLLPELQAINWLKRRVYLLFDSDVVKNEQVQSALMHLSEELAAHGALPFFVQVPSAVDGSKQGLDDWIVHNPGATLAELCRVHQPLTVAEKLHELNEKFSYVLERGFVIDKTTLAKYPTERFKDSFGNANYAELVPTGEGMALKKANLAASWVKWPCRAQVNDLCYEPGKPTYHEDKFNIWQGWGCEPVKGDVTPFLELIGHLFTGAEQRDMDWFLRWLAYPLQYPGTKMFTAAILWGSVQGTGKSLVGVSMSKIYGKNYQLIKNKELHSNFNSWAEGKQFIMGDEITGRDKREDGDLIKSMISQLEITINAKYMPEYTVRDCVNYLFNSNHADSFFLELTDRRLFVHEVLVGPKPDSFYNKYKDWLDNGGASHLFHYLLNLPLGDFSPTSAALRTTAKDRMIADVQSDLGEWVSQLLSCPDAVLVSGENQLPGDLFSARELLAVFDPSGHKRITAPGIARELRKQRALMVCQGKMVSYSPKVRAERYFAIRNPARWTDVDIANVIQELKHVKGGDNEQNKY